MHIWARGHFISTVGIDSTVIQNYVKEQEEKQIREVTDATVEGRQRMTL